MVCCSSRTPRVTQHKNASQSSDVNGPETHRSYTPRQQLSRTCKSCEGDRLRRKNGGRLGDMVWGGWEKTIFLYPKYSRLLHFSPAVKALPPPQTRGCFS